MAPLDTHGKQGDLKVVHDRDAGNSFEHVPVHAYHRLSVHVTWPGAASIKVRRHHLGIGCVRQQVEPEDAADLDQVDVRAVGVVGAVVLDVLELQLDQRLVAVAHQMPHDFARRNAPLEQRIAPADAAALAAGLGCRCCCCCCCCCCLVRFVARLRPRDRLHDEEQLVLARGQVAFQQQPFLPAASVQVFGVDLEVRLDVLELPHPLLQPDHHLGCATQVAEV
ncbi:hypothetical protein CMQ_2127 [Grosmannia clavigera kw1407]|uniref:Uncharacterized protein n=1 Tax=Grosmannia clavigera (strain kw1407 / UAMH 11150) TaxID=655863 RepID=F0XIY8_GROCL|nr:uncharacterized protein CMQ_2127 [Grosmannia clavigera kw1407]EFX02078.1 hypothetical protein CMQ_2127 [Grosmannia clavigera kw1407]